MGGRHFRLRWGVVLALVIVDGLWHDAWAIPAFTRKFDLPCSQCHTIPPTLNDFGETFRTGGYRMAGLAEQVPETLREQVRRELPEDLHPAYLPLSARVVMGYRYRSRDHQDTDLGEAKLKTRTSGLERFDLMAGGLLTPDVNFYITYQPTVTNADLETSAGQEGRVESAWIRFNDVAVTLPILNLRPKVNVKVGSFELDVPASRYRRYTLSTYPIFGYFSPGNAAADDPDTTLDWSRAQLGAEVSGHGPGNASLSLALINGTNGHADSNKAFDYYLRGTLPVAENRFGGFVYWGTAASDFQFTPGGDPIAGTGISNHSFRRFGVDGDFKSAPLRVLGLLEYGTDSAGLFGGSDPQSASFGGGYIEVQYDLLKERSLMGVVRYDIIRNSGRFLFLDFQQGDATTDAQKGDLDAITLAARYDLIETTRLSLIIHGEYSHEKTKGTSVDGHDETDNRMTVAVDLML
jgi:hypothetical protein